MRLVTASPSTQIIPMHYVYLLKNKATAKLYIGVTNNLRRRFIEHGEKNPRLLYYEAYQSKKDAWRREAMLKQRGQSIRWLKTRLADTLE